MKISNTFWGQAWEKHLATFSDYENRLPRGRSYLRGGKVLDLAIARGEVTATVVGSSIYDTRVTLSTLPDSQWKHIVSKCSGDVGSMLDLLAGKLGDESLRLLTHPEHGIFPRPQEMRFSCSCPDWADMCKHVAAMLYGVGLRLDEDPTLLFILRGVDSSDLLQKAATDSLQGLADLSATGGELGDTNLSSLFGIDIADDPPILHEDPPPPPKKPRKPAAKQAGKQPAKRARKPTQKKSPTSRTPAKKAAKKSTSRGKTSPRRG